MRVVVRFQFIRLVRVTVRAVFSLVLVLLRIALMGMLVLMFVFVDVVVLMSVHGFVVRVLVCMGMSVFVLMLVAMIVFTCHWVSSLFSVWRVASPDKPILADLQAESQAERHGASRCEIVLVILPVQDVLRVHEGRHVLRDL